MTSLNRLIIGTLQTYSNVPKPCKIYLYQRDAVITYPDPKNVLNKRSEIILNCFHQRKFLLINCGTQN